MEDFEKAIKAHNLKRQAGIINQFSDDLEKAGTPRKAPGPKSYPIGTVRNGRKKMAEGKWVPVKGEKKSKATEKPKSKYSKEEFKAAVKSGAVTVERSDLHEWQDEIPPSVKMYAQHNGEYKLGKVDWDKTNSTDEMTIKFEDGSSAEYDGFNKTVYRVKKSKLKKAEDAEEILGTGEFEKGHPVGYINKYGKQKQGDGSWKYVGKAAGKVYQEQGGPAASAKRVAADKEVAKQGESYKTKKSVAAFTKMLGKKDAKITISKNGSGDRIVKVNGATAFNMESKDVQSRKAQMENAYKRSQPEKKEKINSTKVGQRYNVTDDRGTVRLMERVGSNSAGATFKEVVNGRTTGRESALHEGYISSITPAKKEMTFREVLDDRTPGGGRELMDSIDEYRGDLRDQPDRKEHMDGLRHTVKELKEKTGYTLDISEQEDNYKEAKATQKESKMSSAAGQVGESVLNNKDADYRQSEAAEKAVDAKIKALKKRDSGLGLSDAQHKELVGLEGIKKKLALRNTYSSADIRDMSMAAYKRKFMKSESFEENTISKARIMKAEEILGMGEFEKGHPVGYINKYGKQKQGDGSWKYVGKGGKPHAKPFPTESGTPPKPATPEKKAEKKSSSPGSAESFQENFDLEAINSSVQKRKDALKTALDAHNEKNPDNKLDKWHDHKPEFKEILAKVKEKHPVPGLVEQEAVQSGILGTKLGAKFPDWDTGKHEAKPKEYRKLGTEKIKKGMSMLSQPAAVSLLKKIDKAVQSLKDTGSLGGRGGAYVNFKHGIDSPDGKSGVAEVTIWSADSQVTLKTMFYPGGATILNMDTLNQKVATSNFTNDNRNQFTKIVSAVNKEAGTGVTHDVKEFTAEDKAKAKGIVRNRPVSTSVSRFQGVEIDNERGQVQLFVNTDRAARHPEEYGSRGESAAAKSDAWQQELEEKVVAPLEKMGYQVTQSAR